MPWLVAVAFFMESLDTTILNTAVPAISEALKVAPLSMKSVLASYTLEPGGFHTDQRVDGGPVRNAAGVCFGDRTFHTRIISLRHIQQHPFAGGVPHFAGLRRSHDGAGRAAHSGANVCQVRTHSRDELRGDSRAGWPDAWTDCRGLDRRIFTLAIYFLREHSDRARRFVDGLLHLPDYREKTHPLDIVGLILFGSGIALLSYVLEIFGEHELSTGEILGLLAVSLSLIGGYLLHARQIAFPLLRLSLFRIRTFSAAVSGSFFTRLGIGGVPFLLPLLYQVGLGFTPIQSGLLIMPQALASMSTKFLLPKILNRIGYRGVLISNTVILGLLLLLFATIGLHTPVWVIVIQAFCYGAFTSLQYTSMNTLVYADVTEEETSSASSIASTTQQMSISFGVAAAGLATAFFVPRVHSNPAEMIQGVHKALLVLGLFTILSAVIFSKLKSGDGQTVSQHKVVHAE